MNQAEEIALRIDSLFDLISQNPASLLSKLAQAKSLCKPFVSQHAAFEEVLSLLDTAAISLQETLNLLQSALSDVDPDPRKKELLDQKLATIDQMKRKYGASIDEWNRYKQELEKKIEMFYRLEEKKEEVDSKIQEIELKLSALAQEISKKRTQAAKILEAELTKTIQSLNMQGASLQIQVEKQARTLTGEDRIDFHLTANVGEGSTLVKESSSGGELSRLLLAVKLALAEKNRTPTLIFDEIDAGVGGETARLIGEQLKELSLHRQVLCITHFPQVACQAHLHLRVHKQQEEERTFAKIEKLDSSLQETELLRMCGGKKTFSF
jgi:DNA repair protein RecN (Recombination protein N)